MSDPRGRLAGSAALTSLATAATMVSGGIFALLIAARFGTSARTDGFFAAYGVYTVAVLVAQSMRTTIVSRLVDRGFAGFNSFLGAVAVLSAVAGVVFVALGAPLAALLTGGPADGARDVATDTLLLLWPAASLQLVAALGAAMLGVLDDFRQAALAYGAGSIASIAAFLLLAGPVGILATPLSVLIGSAVTAVPLVRSVRAAGWSPGRPVGSWGGARLVVLGAGQVALAQGLYLITIAAAAEGGQGAATTYAYGYFAHQLVLALVASSLSIVLAAPIAATWDRDPASLRPHAWVVLRAGLLVLVPVVATAAFVGDDLGDLLLGNFSAAQVDQVVSVFLALVPAIVVAQALAVVLVGIYTLGRFVAATLVGLPVIALHWALTRAVDATDLTELALVASFGAVTFGLALSWVLFGAAAPAFAGGTLRELARVLVPAAACFAVAALLAGGLGDAAALAAGLLAYGALVAAIPPLRASALQLLSAVRR